MSVENNNLGKGESMADDETLKPGADDPMAQRGIEAASTPESRADQVELPAETRMLLDMVTDADAKGALENYAQAMIAYVTELKKNPDLSQDQIDDLKTSSAQALDAVGQYKGKPGVNDALLAIMYAEMSLQM